MLVRLRRFAEMEAAGGIVLFAAAVIALVLANSLLGPVYEALLDMPVSVQVGALKIAKPFLLWVNDGLMAIFFMVVGLEVKREILEGSLSTLRGAATPAAAAAGGMAIPALVYVACIGADPTALRGWAIPTATDIAFALGVSPCSDRACRARLRPSFWRWRSSTISAPSSSSRSSTPTTCHTSHSSWPPSVLPRWRSSTSRVSRGAQATCWSACSSGSAC